VDQTPPPEPANPTEPSGFLVLPKPLPRPPRTVAAPRVSPGPLAWIVWSICGAVAAAVLWAMVNYSYQVNGVGFLDRLGSPFLNVYICAAVGAVIAGVAGVVAHLHARRHADEVADASDAMGLSYTSVVSQEQMREYRTLTLFTRWWAAHNRMKGHIQGVPVEVVDYTFLDNAGSDIDTYHHQTVVLLPAEDGSPSFELSPRGSLGLLECLSPGHVSFDAERAATVVECDAIKRFNGSYFLSDGLHIAMLGRSEEDATEARRARAAIRRWFTPEVLAEFAARPGWCVESDGRHLAVWRSDTIVAGAQRASLVAEAMALPGGIAEARGASVGPNKGAAAVASVPDGLDAGAHLVGTIVGSLGGFLAGVIAAFACSIWLFMRDPFAPDGMAYTPLLFLGSTLGGCALGAWLGKRWLSYAIRAAGRFLAMK
jgi:hypothetical protein